MKKFLISLALLMTAGAAHAEDWFYVNTDDSFDKRSCVPYDKDPEISSRIKFGDKNFEGRYIQIADGSRVYSVFWNAPSGRTVHLAFANQQKDLPFNPGANRAHRGRVGYQRLGLSRGRRGCRTLSCMVVRLQADGVSRHVTASDRQVTCQRRAGAAGASHASLIGQSTLDQRITIHHKVARAVRVRRVQRYATAGMHCRVRCGNHGVADHIDRTGAADGQIGVSYEVAS